MGLQSLGKGPIELLALIIDEDEDEEQDIGEEDVGEDEILDFDGDND